LNWAIRIQQAGRITVLTSIKVNKNSIQIRPFISLEMALNIQEKGLTISKTTSNCKKRKR